MRLALCALRRHRKVVCLFLTSGSASRAGSTSHHEGLRLQHIPRTCMSKSLGSASLPDGRKAGHRRVCAFCAVEESKPVHLWEAAKAVPGMILE